MANVAKYSTVKDEELVRQITEEHQTALFGILYARYHKKVADKSYSLLKNSELSQEAVQVIFIRAYERLPGFRGEAAFSSWLYSITYNYCIDFLRKQKQLHYPEWNSQQDLSEIIDEENEDIERFDDELFTRLLDEIHPEEKALLMMKYIDNISIRDISIALRISESAAKMRLKRARARLLFLYQEKNKDTSQE
ncbi:MAG TPA: RNA polymerase sigma factor [Bacteroidales bacterium]|nr:RNA polymerase sigma factor [Bacteroidales bacterium]